MNLVQTASHRRTPVAWSAPLRLGGPVAAGDILAQIGNTPLLDLSDFVRRLGVGAGVADQVPRRRGAPAPRPWLRLQGDRPGADDQHQDGRVPRVGRAEEAAALEPGRAVALGVGAAREHGARPARAEPRGERPARPRRRAARSRPRAPPTSALRAARRDRSPASRSRTRTCSAPKAC